MSDVRTFLLDGVNADTVSYTLAPGLAQFIQAVYIEVDNSAGGDTNPVLSISEQSGVVIAKKRQGESIPAGDSGTATWALRLTDESTGTGSGGIQFDTLNVGDWLDVHATGANAGNGIKLNSDAGQIKLTVNGGNSELDMQTSGQTDLFSSDLGVHTSGHFSAAIATFWNVVTHGHITFQALSDSQILLDASAGTTGSVDWNGASTTVNIDNDETHFVGGDFTIDAGGIVLDGIIAGQGGAVSFELPTGRTFELKDHNGATKWRWTEGTTVLHGPTGGSIVFDL